jgi:membrane associated rhomboid family serine protease
MVNAYKISKKSNFLGGMSLNTFLIVVNVFLFIVFSSLISLKVLSIDFVAINPNNVLHGKYLWTFLTSMFMHGGIFHLFVNMLSLFFVGSLVERLIGRKRYFWFYILSGIFAGLVFVLSALVFPQDLNTYAVGASGALFGLIGILMFLTPNLPVYIMFIPIPIKLKYAAPGMLVLLWIISVTGNVPIGNIAHLGGLIAGLAYGFYLRQKYKRKSNYIRKYFV